MTASAPRYDRRLLAAARRLDDDRLPMAETCRRVGDAAEAMGLARPSYVHLRRFIGAQRELRRELDAVRNDAIARVLAGYPPDVVLTFARIREGELAAELRRQS